MYVQRSERVDNQYTKNKNNKLSKNNIIQLIPRYGKIKDGIFIKNGSVVRKNMKISDPNWAVIDPLLGRVSDERIASFFVVPVNIIEMRRNLLHILPYGHIEWDIIDSLLKYGTDEEISQMFNGNIQVGTIKARRAYLDKTR